MNPNITRNSLVDIPRLELLEKYVIDKQFIPGFMAEVGVYKGGTALLLCETNDLKGSQKSIILFDTFEGMPEADPNKDKHSKGDFNDTSLEAVQKLLSGFSSVYYAKGLFPGTSTALFPNTNYSLVHLDCDLYASVKAGLEFFYPRMSPGGIIILDDYNEPDCPGAKQAADEFCAKVGNKVIPTVQSQAIINIGGL